MIVASRPKQAATNDTPDCDLGVGSQLWRNLTMTHRTIGIDLAIRGDHVAQIFDDGRPAGVRYASGMTRTRSTASSPGPFLTLARVTASRPSWSRRG